MARELVRLIVGLAITVVGTDTSITLVTRKLEFPHRHASLSTEKVHACMCVCFDIKHIPHHFILGVAQSLSGAKL